MHEPQVADVRLVVPGGHPPVLFDLRPEPLGDGPVLVPLPVDVPLLLAVLPGRDHRRRAPGLDPVDQLLLVVPPVATATSNGTPAIRASAWVTSAACPGVRISLAGSPSPLMPPWILVVNPPRLRPMAWSAWPPV